MSQFNKDVLTKTSEGNALISKYFAENLDRLSMHKEVCLNIDSDFITEDF